jgi:hypothetical protein
LLVGQRKRPVEVAQSAQSNQCCQWKIGKKIATTARGARVARAVAEAHQHLVQPVLDGWSERDVVELTRLMHRLADDVAQLRETLEPV